MLHRDIKPSNLVFDERGRLWITDFGLAHLGDEETFTRTGDVLGTYHYMSPEQAAGNKSRVDARSDVYSLGATLYEIVTLRRPFHDLAMPRLLRAIAHEPPQRLRRHARAPAALQAIVSQAMEKSPDDRYGTAAEFAEDLDRFASGRKTQAEQAARFHRAAGWLRRHQRAIAALLLVGVLALLSGFVGLQYRAVQLRKVDEALKVQQAAIGEIQYAETVRSAYDALSAGDAAAAAEIVAEWEAAESTHPPGVEWRHLRRFAQAPTPLQVVQTSHGAVHSVALFPDQTRLASVGEDGSLAIWDLDRGEPASRWMVSESPLHAVAVSPSGDRVAVGGDDDLATLLDASTGSVIGQWGPFENHVESLAFSPDGGRLAVGVAYDPIQLCDLATGAMQSLEGEDRNETLRFSPDGSRLIGVAEPPESTTDILRMWSLSSSEAPQQELAIEAPAPSSPRFFEFASDGTWLFVVDRHSAVASYYAADTGELLFEIPAVGEREALAATMSPDDRWCAVGLASGKVRYWGVRPHDPADWRRGGETGSFQAHQGHVLHMVYAADGALITASRDGLIKVWPTARASHQAVQRDDLMFQRLETRGEEAVFALLHRAGQSGFGRFDVREQAWQEAMLGESRTGFTLSADQRSLCAFGSAGSVAILSGVDGAVLAADAQGEKTVLSAAFSPSGDFVAVGDQTGRVTLRSAADLTIRASFDVASRVGSLAFSSDGAYLACTDEEGRVHLVDVASWRIVQTAEVHSQSVIAAWRPDSHILFTGHFDGRIHAWDAGALAKQFTLREHRQTVSGLSFAPDGRTLFSASSDGTIRVWQTETGASMGVLYRAPAGDAQMTRVASLGENGLAALQWRAGEARLLLWQWE